MEEAHHALVEVIAPAQHKVDQKRHERSHHQYVKISGDIAVNGGDKGFRICMDPNLLHNRHSWSWRWRGLCGTSAFARLQDFFRPLLNLLPLLTQTSWHQDVDALFLELIEPFICSPPQITQARSIGR